MIELLRIFLYTLLSFLWCLVKTPFLLVITFIGVCLGFSEEQLLTCLFRIVAEPIKCLLGGFSEMVSCVSDMLGNKVKTSVRRKIAEKRNDKYQ